MTDTKPYLQIKGLAKKYGDNLAVKPLNLEINQHEIFALLGSSGSGKSTLLRMLAGMEIPSEGQIILDGQDITKLAPYDRPINMMFQSYALFPHMTVADNIAFGLKQDKLPKDEIAARVDEMLRLVQMPQFAKRKPHQLSGGQQQRVALARSLAKRPKLLLLDEPLGALDKKLRQQTQFELVNTLEKVGVTCIMVTHDQEEAMTMASRVAIMSHGELQQVGTPADVYDYPESTFVAEFIGETNIFEGKLVHKDDAHALIDCPELPSKVYTDQKLEAENGQTIWVSIRPEDIDLHKEKPAHRDTHNWAKGKVKEIAYLGSFAIYHVQMENGRIIKSQVPAPYWYVRGIEPPTWGDEVYLDWPENQPTPLTTRKTWGGKLVIGVPFVWLLLLFLVPFFIILKISFAEQALSIPPFTPLFNEETGALQVSLQNYKDIFADLGSSLGALLNPFDGGNQGDNIYLLTYWLSIKTALTTTLICLLIGYPMAYAISRAHPSIRNGLLLAIMLPFWTSFLLRVYAWMGLLGQNGIINNYLMKWGVISEPLNLFYNTFSLNLVMVYAYLPFMILPLYTQLVKLDHRLLEAAADLGAHPIKAFFQITLPLSKSGIIAGSMLVFIPAVGEYVIPELVGGPDNLMIGKVLWQAFFDQNNWPLAAAVAVLMVILLVVPMAMFQHFEERELEGDK